MPENCQSAVDITHSKPCCHHLTDSYDQSVSKSSSSLCDTRSDYISSDISSEGLSLSDGDDKPLQDTTNLQTSTSTSPMNQYISNGSQEVNDSKSLRRKSGQLQGGCFSNGILPIREIEHLDTIGTPKCFKRGTSNPVQDDRSLTTFLNTCEDFPLQESSPRHSKQVNIFYIQSNICMIRKLFGCSLFFQQLSYFYGKIIK